MTIKPECKTCPCIQVNGCEKCPHFDEVTGCFGIYSAERSQRDTIEVKIASQSK